ncbi:peroxiredoxin family protein [Camelliibacillus cellulosilyticus]|uniref:Peroxiredoxin family protein n=1 Tax=Camelliibacillus cellulosilyticus TaxID=2174486 RepID=A0ABV9GS93_9BACL
MAGHKFNLSFKKTWMVLTSLTLFFLVTATAVFAYCHEQNSDGHPKQQTKKQAPPPIRMTIGKLRDAPDFTLKTLDGDNMSLKQFRGSSVLVVAWATWCGECLQELETLQKLQKNAGDLSLEILAVNMTSEESSIHDVKRIAASFQPSFPILLDSKGKVEETYHIYGIPSSFLIDPYGKILHVFNGVAHPKDILNWLPQS